MEYQSRVVNNEIEITAYTGQESVVRVPAKIDALQVTSIGSKAFLSRDKIRELSFPDGIRQVGDWAFCHMKSLKTLSFSSFPAFGRQLFKGTEQIEAISFPGFQSEKAGRLLARLVWFWQAGFMRLQDYGEDAEGFFEEYDREFLRYLSEANDKEYVPGFVGWFDDGDIDSKKAAFEKEIIKRKIELAFVRLWAADEMECVCEEELRQYLIAHKEQVFEVLCEGPCTRTVDYFRIWEGLGGFEFVPASQYLEHMELPEPEVAAFLMSRQTKSNRFFDNLSL